MRSLVAIFFAASFAVLGAPRAQAAEWEPLPPLATFGDNKSGTGAYTLDMKGDRSFGTGNIQSGFPPAKKEEVIPFIGLSLTRPLDFKK